MIFCIDFKMYDEFIPLTVASNYMHAYKISAICSISIYSRHIYGMLCTKEHVDILLHGNTG